MSLKLAPGIERDAVVDMISQSVRALLSLKLEGRRTGFAVQAYFTGTDFLLSLKQREAWAGSAEFNWPC